MFRAHDFDGLPEHCPAVDGMTRTCGGTHTVSYGAKTRQIEVLGIEPSWHKVTNRPIVMGRPFTLLDDELPRAVCLIDDKTRDELGLDADPTGQAIMVAQRRYTVVGMVSPSTDDPWQGGDRASLEVYVPFKILYNPTEAVWVQISARSPDQTSEARAEIHAFLRHKRHLGFAKPDNFEVWAVQKALDDFESMATGITVVASGIVTISLLVGGIGIMNIMLVSVSERTREIGLRKAVGARPAAILLQFLIEALVLCLLGGLMGLLAGAGITAMLKCIPGIGLDKAAIPAWAVALSFGFAATVGLVFGIFPAIMAALLDPITALRHE
jgi:putative ABC transport system permease protein